MSCWNDICGMAMCQFVPFWTETCPIEGVWHTLSSHFPLHAAKIEPFAVSYILLVYKVLLTYECKCRFTRRFIKVSVGKGCLWRGSKNPLFTPTFLFAVCFKSVEQTTFIQHATEAHFNEMSCWNDKCYLACSNTQSSSITPPTHKIWIVVSTQHLWLSMFETQPQNIIFVKFYYIS